MSSPVKAKVIHVFPNGDKHHSGLRYVVHPKMSFEQVLIELSSKVPLATGAIRKLVTAEGHTVAGLEELHDGGAYVACGSEKLRTDLLAAELLRKSGKSAEAPTTPKSSAPPTAAKPAPSSSDRQKFGVQADKSKVITVYANGDKHHPGHRYVVHPKMSFEQLLVELSSKVPLSTGAVRKLVTPDGHTVSGLDHLHDSCSYVACGSEPLSIDHLPTALADTKKPPAEKPTVSPAAPTTKPAPAPTTTGDGKGGGGKAAGGERQKFGVQADKAAVVWFFRNGDKHHQGERITVSAAKYKNVDQLLVDLSKRVKLTTGAVRKIVDADGHSITKLSDLHDGGAYVCCGGEPLSRSHLPTAFVTATKQLHDKSTDPQPPVAATSESTPAPAADPTADEDHNHEPLPDDKPLTATATAAADQPSDINASGSSESDASNTNAATEEQPPADDNETF